MLPSTSLINSLVTLTNCNIWRCYRAHVFQPFYLRPAIHLMSQGNATAAVDKDHGHPDGRTRSFMRRLNLNEQNKPLGHLLWDLNVRLPVVYFRGHLLNKLMFEMILTKLTGATGTEATSNAKKGISGAFRSEGKENKTC